MTKNHEQRGSSVVRHRESANKKIMEVLVNMPVLELESIEKEEVSSFAMPTLAESSAQGDYPSTSPSISVADLYNLVNSE